MLLGSTKCVCGVEYANRKLTNLTPFGDREFYGGRISYTTDFGNCSCGRKLMGFLGYFTDGSLKLIDLDMTAKPEEIEELDKALETTEVVEAEEEVTKPVTKPAPKPTTPAKKAIPAKKK